MYSIGVDLGGTKISVGLVDENGNLAFEKKVLTIACEGMEAVVGRIFSLIDEAMLFAPLENILGIGIAAPGPLNYSEGILYAPPNLPGWDRVPLRDIVSKQFSLPAFLDNDANAAGLAEYHFGAGKYTKNMIYITFSTGIGAGIIMDGKLLRGQTGAASEVGHIIIKADGPCCTCGNRGCLEALASGTAIAKRATEEYGYPLDAKQVVDLANTGDNLAKDILSYAFHYLAIGIVNLINLFDPSIIILGGGLSQIGDPLFETLRKEVGGNNFKTLPGIVPIVPAELGISSGIVGAGILAFLYSGRP